MQLLRQMSLLISVAILANWLGKKLVVSEWLWISPSIPLPPLHRDREQRAELDVEVDAIHVIDNIIWKKKRMIEKSGWDCHSQKQLLIYEKKKQIVKNFMAAPSSIVRLPIEKINRIIREYIAIWNVYTQKHIHRQKLSFWRLQTFRIKVFHQSKILVPQSHTAILNKIRFAKKKKYFTYQRFK